MNVTVFSNVGNVAEVLDIEQVSDIECLGSVELWDEQGVVARGQRNILIYIATKEVDDSMWVRAHYPGHVDIVTESPVVCDLRPGSVYVYKEGITTLQVPEVVIELVNDITNMLSVAKMIEDVKKV